LKQRQNGAQLLAWRARQQPGSLAVALAQVRVPVAKRVDGTPPGVMAVVAAPRKRAVTVSHLAQPAR
jgi:hypothetical protein